MKHNQFRLSVAAAAAATLLLTGCGGINDDDRQQAEDAALQATGDQGRVTEVDEGDDDETAAYVVEVTLDDGESLDVELDDSFAVLNQGEIDTELSQSGAQPDAGGSTDSASPSADASPSASTPARVDDDTPLEGDIKEQAEQAALAEVGDGRVEESTYADPDESHAYEVEIDQGDDDVTVELDESFTVVRVDR